MHGGRGVPRESADSLPENQAKSSLSRITQLVTAAARVGYSGLPAVTPAVREAQGRQQCLLLLVLVKPSGRLALGWSSQESSGFCSSS